jgi:copper chaperone
MAQQRFAVDGLRCEGCAQAITDALINLPEVAAVDVEVDTTGASTVWIEADPPLGAAEVQAALQDWGNFSVLS